LRDYAVNAFRLNLSSGWFTIVHQERFVELASSRSRSRSVHACTNVHATPSISQGIVNSRSKFGEEFGEKSAGKRWEGKKLSVSRNLRGRKNQVPSERALSVLIPYARGNHPKSRCKCARMHSLAQPAVQPAPRVLASSRSGGIKDLPGGGAVEIRRSRIFNGGAGRPRDPRLRAPEV